ncbi:MAG TPA: hypothetical protein VIN40_00805 [Candidatus Tyrphobacter sp.]
MIAREIHLPSRIRNPRTARSATQRRVGINRRSRYAALLKVTLAVAAGMAVMLGYVLLTSNITALSYAVQRAHAQRTELELQDARIDDQIASLTSDDRLAAVATRLGMIQPEAFLRISLQAPRPSGIQPLAFLPLH